MKKGICCAGNIIVDITYPIATWPKQNELTHITEGITNSTGGSVCNTITDLARLDPEMHLVASGFAGHDAEGDFVATITKAGLTTPYQEQTYLELQRLKTLS